MALGCRVKCSSRGFVCSTERTVRVLEIVNRGTYMLYYTNPLQHRGVNESAPTREDSVDLIGYCERKNDVINVIAIDCKKYIYCIYKTIHKI